MIVYGWNSKVLKESPFPNHTCESCNSTDSYVVVSASYAHVFWIPIFPYKKKLNIVCGSCGLNTQSKYASGEVMQLAKQLKSTVKIPIYMYAGSGVIGALIAFFIISGFLDGQKMEGYLEDPQANDIYVLHDKEETTDYKYYLWKAKEVSGDTVSIAFNSFHYNWEPTRLEPEDGFYNMSVNMHKDDLLRLYKDNEITTVQRGFKPSSGFGREIEFSDQELEELIGDITETDSTSEGMSN